MAIQRTRKSKANPNYNFLISWDPKHASQARVKRERVLDKATDSATLRHSKSAVSLAQEGTEGNFKKGIVRSLILVGFILILELVVYLAWNKFGLS